MTRRVWDIDVRVQSQGVVTTDRVVRAASDEDDEVIAMQHVAFRVRDWAWLEGVPALRDQQIIDRLARDRRNVAPPPFTNTTIGHPVLAADQDAPVDVESDFAWPDEPPAE